MKLPLTLSFYIIRQFLWSFLIVFSVFTILIILMDAVELIRKSSGKDIPFYILIEMVILKFPLLIQIIMPFIVLVGSSLAYSSMAKKQELVIIRSAGVSAWEFLLPSIFCAFILGIVVVTIFNPIASIMLSRYEVLEAKYFYNKQNLLEISEQGLWIRQEIKKDDFESDYKVDNVILHAEDISGENNVNLTNVSAFIFDKEDMFKFRIDSKIAQLTDNSWKFLNAKMTYSDGSRGKEKEYLIPTLIKTDDIQKSFSDPQIISFWELPNFISKLNKSGFSDIYHVIHYQKLLSSPLFYAAMVIIGALFSLKAPRQGMIGYSIAFSLMFGFLIYFLSNLVSSIGLSGSLPIILAAWAPVFVSGFLGFMILLHFEDG